MEWRHWVVPLLPQLLLPYLLWTSLCPLELTFWWRCWSQQLLWMVRGGLVRALKSWLKSLCCSLEDRKSWDLVDAEVPPPWAFSSSNIKRPWLLSMSDEEGNDQDPVEEGWSQNTVSNSFWGSHTSHFQRSRSEFGETLRTVPTPAKCFIASMEGKSNTPILSNWVTLGGTRMWPLPLHFCILNSALLLFKPQDHAAEVT